MKVHAMLTLAVAATVFIGNRAETDSHSMNPVRKVVNMLQDMQKKVTEEGKRDEDLFEKFMCYCKNSGNDLQESIDKAEAKIESLTSELKGAAEKKQQTEAALAEHKSSHAEAKNYGNCQVSEGKGSFRICKTQFGLAD